MYRKIGGIHWFSLGKFRFMFTIVKPKVALSTVHIPQPTMPKAAQLQVMQAQQEWANTCAMNNSGYWVDDETGEVVR